MKQPYWVEFVTRQPACIEAGSTAEACLLALEATKSVVAQVRVLPYPATPRIGEPTDCPAFCYSPRECAGRTSCPKSYACSE